MIMNRQLINDVELLLEAEDYDALRSWFGYWKTEEELIDKVMIFGQTFLQHYFRQPSPIFHRELVRAFFSKENEYMAAPRGYSKTTVLQCCILMACCIEFDTFIVVIEKTFGEAAEVIDGVRAECVDNTLLVKTFGDLIGGRNIALTESAMKEKDAEGDLFINGVRLRAKGFDQPIRGLKSRQWRPSRVLADDIEQDAHINVKAQRDKYRSRYDKGVQPAVDIDGCIKVFGTILHEDSLLNNLIKAHNGKVFRAYYIPNDPEWDECDAYTRGIRVNGKLVKLLWPTRWTYPILMKKKQDMLADNKSSNAFEQEYRNHPIAEDQREFKWEWLHNELRTIELDDILKGTKMLTGYAAIDTADSVANTADYIGLVVHFLDSEGNKYRVDVRRERRNITGLIELIFEVWERWHKHGLIKIGIEKKAFNDQVKPLLDSERLRRGGRVHPVVEELKPMGRNKEGRIRGALVGAYELGKIWTVTVAGVPVGDTEHLLDELYNFPKSAFDDISDAESYLAEISVAPLEDEKRPDEHRDPSEDPWRKDKVTISSRFEDDQTDQNIETQHDIDADPY